ncbi:MAG TPA: hypothetical protein DDY14_10140 [Chromatiaceae bacterium]|jgi:CHASE2 domain-containing sensor protein|nr:MAG: hypothetical protein N838_28745 [Thiohalocapsa sp. PB-PSB1]QQO57834.1 MAG: hypothetical protein N838_12465 [Thiohalocapsa sp. PB-PSB1]HBG95657.1 hypothetical protein [Chromatiaceae bacterium]
MIWLESQFAEGRIIDLILVLIAAEAMLLAWVGQRTKDRRLFADIAPTLISGALLLLTLRIALVGGWWGWIALMLALALGSHLVDLGLRWHQRTSQQNDT